MTRWHKVNFRYDKSKKSENQNNVRSTQSIHFEKFDVSNGNIPKIHQCYYFIGKITRYSKYDLKRLDKWKI